MQDSAPCSAHRAKATLDDVRNIVLDFAVEKTVAALCSSHQIGWATIRHIFR